MIEGNVPVDDNFSYHFHNTPILACHIFQPVTVLSVDFVLNLSNDCGFQYIEDLLRIKKNIFIKYSVMKG